MRREPGEPAAGDPAAAGGAYDRPLLAWGRFVLRFRGPLLAIMAAVTAILGHQAVTRLQIDTSLEAFLSTEAEVRVRLERFRDLFGRDEVFVVVVEGDVYSAGFVRRLRALHGAVEAVAIPGHPDAVAEVLSLVNARHVAADDFEIRVGDLFDLLPRDGPPDAASLAALRAAAGRSPSVVGNLVAADGRAAAVVVRVGRVAEEVAHAVHWRLVELARAHRAPGFEIRVAGAPALAAAIRARMLADAYRSLAVGAVLIAGLLALLFRHWLAVAGPLLVIGVSIVWTYGLMALGGYPMTALHNILPTFLLAVGLGDSVHLLSVFRTERRAGHPHREAVVRAVGATGLPIIFTSLTTSLGMLGFTVTRLGVTTEFGAFAAIGVMIALLCSLVVLPALLGSRLGAGIGAAESRPGVIERTVDRIVGLGVQRSGAVLGATLLLCVAAALGIARVRVSHDPLRFLPDGHPVREAFAAADARLGGSVNLEVVVDGGERDALLEPALLRAWSALEAHARAYVDPATGAPGVGGVASFLDVIRETWAALNADRPDAPPLPPDRPAAAQTQLLFESAGPDEAGRFATPDRRLGRLSLRVPWRDAGSYAPLTAWIERGIARSGLAEHAEVWPTGGVYTLFSVISSLIEDFLRSFALAAGLIAVMMILLLRDLRLGLLAMIPNLLPIGLTLGVMGWLDIPLDMFNLLIGSLAIGLAVDDTIHFFHHVAAQRRAGVPDVEAAVRHAGRYAGRAMFVTSVVLVIGFGAFLTAGMRNLVIFGGLVGLAIVFALLADLLVGPALLRATRRRAPASPGREPRP